MVLLGRWRILAMSLRPLPEAKSSWACSRTSGGIGDSWMASPWLGVCNGSLGGEPAIGSLSGLDGRCGKSCPQWPMVRRCRQKRAGSMLGTGEKSNDGQGLKSQMARSVDLKKQTYFIYKIRARVGGECAESAQRVRGPARHSARRENGSARRVRGFWSLSVRRAGGECAGRVFWCFSWVKMGQCRRYHPARWHQSSSLPPSCGRSCIHLGEEHETRSRPPSRPA